MLIQAVDTCLSSKVVSQNTETISPMAVDAVLGIIDPLTAKNVDLRDIKVRPFREALQNIHFVYVYMGVFDWTKTNCSRINIKWYPCSMVIF